MEKILLVDDDYITSSLNKLLIEDLLPNAEIIKIGNGLKALDLIDTCLHLNKKLPNLIIIDIKMPVMDGFEFLEELEKRKVNLPCVILTSSSSANDLEKSKSFDILAYLEKPLTTPKLKILLQKFWAYI